MTKTGWNTRELVTEIKTLIKHKNESKNARDRAEFRKMIEQVQGELMRSRSLK